MGKGKFERTKPHVNVGTIAAAPTKALLGAALMRAAMDDANRRDQLTTAQRRIERLEKELQAVVDLHTTAQQLQTAAAIRAVLGVVADDARAALQEAE